MKSAALWMLPLALACDLNPPGPQVGGTEGAVGTTGGHDGHDDGHADDGEDDSADDDEGPDDEGPGEEGPGDEGPGDEGPGDEGPSDTGTDGTGGVPVCYTEPLFPNEAVDDIVGAYGGGAYKNQVIEAMGRRWPAGAFLLQEQINDPYWGQFSDPNSWGGMVGWLDTLVHEQTHLFNAYHAIGVGEPHALYFREDKILYLPPDQGFARSEIMPHLDPQAAGSTYASTYLTGSQGARLFNPLLDEATAYANEVAGMGVFGEYFGGLGVSLRDGSAAFLYFVEVYLRVGRTAHPEWYAWAQTQEVYVEAVELLWLRTHFFYEEAADQFPALGISDDTYRAIAYEPDNIAEIDMFVGKTFTDSSCLGG
ncbi:MAG: hypothetical protein AAF721_03265 [Myxococcota bacterium]